MCGKNVRDGTTTNTIPDRQRNCDKNDCDTDMEFGMHEDFWYYKNCKRRQRNKGLYTADQNMKEDATSTRQNNGGTRRGYECPEERDHYPYWHPTHWRDIVVFTNDPKRCEWYKAESQNVKNKGYCKYPDNYLQLKYEKDENLNNIWLMNNREACEAQEIAHGGELLHPEWVEEGAWDMPPPDCLPSAWSRDNHHGNTYDGFMNSYNWTVPDTAHDNCVLRLRYNITSGEMSDGGFDPEINASLNAEENNAPTGIDVATIHGLEKDNDRGYQFRQNPQNVKVFNIQGQGSNVALDLALALNTNQYGRTFEDRTHVFEIRERPESIPADAKIHNLNVRGKRGNIVQTYPGVEYDYQPNRLEAEVGDYVHIQWTGANSNPQNNAGQGRAGTDRNNIALLREITYPKEGAWEDEAHGCFACNYPGLISNTTNLLGLPWEEQMMLAYHTNKGSFYGDVEELDDTATYFDLGPKRMTQAGIWRFMCTRNNNFTNRSQKGEIRVVPSGETAA